MSSMNMYSIMAILAAICLSLAGATALQGDSQDDSGAAVEQPVITVPEFEEADAQVSQQDTTVPAMPGQNTTAPTMPEQNTMMPPMPSQDGTMPAMPGNGFPQNDQNTTMPTMPGQNTTMPTMPGQNNTMPGFPGQGTIPSMPSQDGTTPTIPSQDGTMPAMPGQGTMPGFPGQQNGTAISGTSDMAGTIVTTDVVSTASDLTADTANAQTIVMSDENNQVKITEAGTYIVTGTCSDGHIVVKKGTTGVVLILKDLNLTSTTGATVSVNKGAEAKIIIEGTVTFTDNEDPADEESTDAEVADAFDGAAIKVKDGANVVLTGTGTLNINGNAKNGIKIGDADTPSFVIDGELTINITAANDGINGGYDVTILSGTLNISVGDDAIHADRILTIGNDGVGPTIDVKKSVEGLEGTVVNLFGGSATLVTSDDAINAANSDGTFASLGYSVNITAGTWTIRSGGDGIDSNGNVNIVGGKVTITSSVGAGEAGIDYDGAFFVSSEANVTNNSGVSGPDMMPGMGGMTMPGQMGGKAFPGQMGGFGVQTSTA